MKTICLLNDSFPPYIDGVANTVYNYARILNDAGEKPIVITPTHPDADYSIYPYPVVRYPSVKHVRVGGYMPGIPFSPQAVSLLEKEEISLLHCHCPIVSAYMALQLRRIKNAPVVMTYHTKFDIEIEEAVKGASVQALCKKAMIANVNACDEVWVVSHGAEENLRSMGYEGEAVLMPNGVDLPYGRVSADVIARATAGFDLPEGLPVYLFVGRLRWYKGVRIILDALKQLRADGRDFRAVFIGDGADRGEMMHYAESCNIGKQCIFPGAIREREALRAWYSRADMFLFPSTFDTNGLVVREAAASDCPSVLIKDSCASEGITHGRNGFLIEENAADMYRCLSALYEKRDEVSRVGRCAGDEIYVSWESAVATATRRYERVRENYDRGITCRNRNAIDNTMKVSGELAAAMGKIWTFRREKLGRNEQE